jgi:hypothetical protein
MTSFRSPILPALSLAFTVALAGCSFSYSSGSISDSLESSSGSLGSSSESSSSGKSVSKDKVPYRDDIANLTYSVAGSSMTASEFPNALTRTARQFKISNWSQEKATFNGIGKGLKKAGIAKENIAKQAFLANVLSSNKDALKLIQEGY